MTSTCGDLPDKMEKRKQTPEHKWYVLYTTPRAEKQVEQRIATEVTEVFLPLHLSPRKWSDRVKLVEVPLFPSYIFVKTHRAQLYDLVRMAGVARILYFQKEPAVLRESEIEAIRNFLEIARGKACSFEVDEVVKVAIGPLAGTFGKIKTVKGKYVVLLLNKLGLYARVAKDQIVK
jgi:transcription antitermination factor NusG